MSRRVSQDQPTPTITNGVVCIWVEPRPSSFAVERSTLYNELANALNQARAMGVQVIVASRNAEPKNGLDLGFVAIWLQQDPMDPWHGSNLEAAVSASKCGRCIVIGDFSAPGVLLCVLGALMAAIERHKGDVKQFTQGQKGIFAFQNDLSLPTNESAAVEAAP